MFLKIKQLESMDGIKASPEVEANMKRVVKGTRNQQAWLFLEATEVQHYVVSRRSFYEDPPLTEGHGYVAVDYSKDPLDGEGDIDEVAIIESTGTDPWAVAFDTVCYICNNNGDTIEVIDPVRLVRTQTLVVPERYR